MPKIPIVYNEPVKIVPKRDIGELLSDCLQELAHLCGGGSVSDQTYELIDAVNEYFELVEMEDIL